MPTTAYYLGLITSEHAAKSNFITTVTTCVDPFVGVQVALRQIEALFDVETAVGDNLDAIGLWVGASRIVPVPISGFYFTWDDTAATGWNVGQWLGYGNTGSGTQTLSDDDYRQLIRGKIQANVWDGSIPGAYLTLQAAFGMSGNVTIQDNQNMTQSVTITGGTLTANQQALLTQGLVPIKPAGVESLYLLPDTAPFDTFIYRPGLLVANDVLSCFHVMARTFYSTKLSWALAHLAVGPTATRTFNVVLTTVTAPVTTATVATLTFAAGATVAVVDILSPDESITLIPGDYIQVNGPAVVDGTAVDLSISLLGWLS